MKKLNANEAKKLTNKFNPVPKMLNIIFKEITDASKNGKNKVISDCVDVCEKREDRLKYYQEVVEELRVLKYKVDFYYLDFVRSYTMAVSW